MPSSQSFAVWLPLLLLGTMASILVFLPIGCIAMKGGLGTGVLNINTDTGILSDGPSNSNLGGHTIDSFVNVSSNSKLPAVPSLSSSKSINRSGKFSPIEIPKATGNAGSFGYEADDAGGAAEPISGASPKQASWRKLHPDMSAMDRALAGMIETKYSLEMKVPIAGLGTDENVKTAVEMMMAMSVSNRALDKNQEGLEDLAIALGIRERYKELLPKYEAIKRKEAGHTEADKHNNANALAEEKSKLADGLFGVLALGDKGTGNPKALAGKQADIVAIGRNVLNVPPEVTEDVLANGKHENPVVEKKAAIMLKVAHLADFLKTTEGIFEKAAMEVMEVFAKKIAEEEEAQSSSHADHVGEEGEGEEHFHASHPHAHDGHDHHHAPHGDSNRAEGNGGNRHNPK